MSFCTCDDAALVARASSPCLRSEMQSLDSRTDQHGLEARDTNAEWRIAAVKGANAFTLSPTRREVMYGLGATLGTAALNSMLQAEALSGLGSSLAPSPSP